MLVIRNALQLVQVCQDRRTRLAGAAMRSPAIATHATLIAENGTTTWIGPDAQTPVIPADADVIDASGKVVLPGLVDSHTHLIFAGERADEFERRLEGASYQELAEKGGGINATVRSVRNASKEQLKQLARPRLRQMLEHGVTTVEVKSGYGLTLADEIKCLEAIADLNAEGPLELVPTFLGAHAVPPEYAKDRAGYVHLLTETMLPEIARCKLAEFCDVFCEKGAFSLAESERILAKARGLGLRLKLHADELTPFGGAELAAKWQAQSADHLLCITEAGIEAMAASETIATLLPGTAFFLGLPYAPARRLLDFGLAIALASDCNPGTCMTENLPLIGAIACTQMKMLPGEALAAMTLNGAAALGKSARVGSLEVGKQADLLICEITDYRQFFYHFGTNHVSQVIKRGQVALDRATF
jgi:imidazolonepropionase